MTQFPSIVVDPLFPDGPGAMVELCERFGRYGMYSQESVESEIGKGLGQRHDSVLNFIKTGGRFGRHEDLKTLARRTNYFREEYAYGQRTLIDGIEPFLNHDAFVAAARAVHGRAVVEPAIVFANLMVPGQELAVHTDVPEFRGANRKVMPQWLLVAMHHSGLFDAWRMPIATGVAWFHDCEGGEFAYYPDGAAGAPVAHKVASNTALVFDADSVFHGVDRIASGTDDMPPLKPGMHLVYEGDEQWSARSEDDATEVARYKWDELRFSVSWKAYCFADDAERERWRTGTDELSLDVVLNTFIADLRRRERILGPIPSQSELALMIIDEYIVFPPALGMTPTRLAAADATVDGVVAAMQSDGYCVVEGLMPADDVAATRAELLDILGATPTGRNDFEGYNTQRIYALFAKTRRFDEWAIHPLLLGVLDRILGQYQLSAPVGIFIGPGEAAQGLHKDQSVYPLPNDFPPVVVNTMWAFDDFTVANGATRLIPGSHRWTDRTPKADDAFVFAEMPAGSVMFYPGNAWHGGGANTTDAPRLGVILEYVASWLRAQENHVLAVPRETVAAMPERLQELLGYNIYPPFVGYVDGRHPRRYITEPVRRP